MFFYGAMVTVSCLYVSVQTSLNKLDFCTFFSTKCFALQSKNGKNISDILVPI